MSWPDDGKPRFVVSSLTAIGGTGFGQRGSGNWREVTDYYVLDRAYDHAIVRAYVAGQHSPNRRTRERRAHEECTMLNAKHAPPLDDELLGLAKRR